MVPLLLFICRLSLRIFFRQLEVAGRQQIPLVGKVMFALNHPNGLIDPLFILCYAGRPVSFLAKAPLFELPVIGYFVRAFRCLPVYRKQDNHDPALNRAMIQHAIQLLAHGNALALFPEGTSHNDPELKPFKSGAARIALKAAAASNDVVHVVPVGLYYSRKQVFRSNALLLFGEPLCVEPEALDESLEPAEERVQDLTQVLAQRVGELTLQAGSLDLIYLAKIAERVVVGANQQQGLPLPANMADRLNFRRKLLLGHAKLEAAHEVASLVERIRAYEASVKALGLRVDQSFDHPPLAVAHYLVRTLLALALLALPGALGLIANYPTYRLVGWITFRYTKAEVDVQATGKVLAGLLLFPLTWLFLSVLLAVSLGLSVGGATLLLMPVCAYLALLLVELLFRMARRGKVLWLSLTKRGFVEKIVLERRSIRDEVLRLASSLDST